MKPYYEKNGITIYLASCEEVLPDLSGVDLIFTSPPYNLNTSGAPNKSRSFAGGKWKAARIHEGYDTYHDDMPYDQYVEWQKRCLLMMWQTLSDRGAIFYNHKTRTEGNEVILPCTLNPGLPLRQEIIWARSGGLNFSPIRYVNTHERILVFARDGFRLRDQGASGLGDVWRVTRESNAPHPATFPIGLPRNAIETTEPGLVCDPFLGSGTTLLAARNHGCRAIGIEISERYCEIAAARLEQPSIYNMMGD